MNRKLNTMEYLNKVWISAVRVISTQTYPDRIQRLQNHVYMCAPPQKIAKSLFSCDLRYNKPQSDSK